MFDYIKSHLHIILIILIIVFLLITIVVFFMPANQTTNVNVDQITPADVVVLNENLSAEQKSASLAALDYLYTYGNYSYEDNRLQSLDGNVTSRMSSLVNNLANEINNNPDKFSTLAPVSENYKVELSGDSATVTIPAILSNNEVQNKSVLTLVTLKMVNSYWVLDGFDVN